MTTPAYGIKHWWRASRQSGESLKAFARSHAGTVLLGAENTARRWLANKAAQKRRAP